MPHIILDDKKLITFAGPDATHLLHNVLTCNVETLQNAVAQIGALLTPQGKIMFDFLVSKHGDDKYLIEIVAAHAAAFILRMTMYRLRSKVEIIESSESFVSVSWEDDSPDLQSGLKDARFKGLDVHRHYGIAADTKDRMQWDELRIEHGVPESGRDYALGEVFPHDVSFDQNGGVDFKKGCYIGQEVVSRMHHRHTARRRILIAQAAAQFDSDEIVSNEKPIGTLGTKVGNKALALCRIDRVKDAIDAGQEINAGGAAITLNLPPHVTYTWPQEAPDA